MKFTPHMVAACAVIGCLGCSPEGGEPMAQRRLVEDLFEVNHLYVFACGGRYQEVGYQLRGGVDPEYAAGEIAAYLHKSPNCRETQFSLDEVAGPVYPPIHPRDFWAMVLAKMKHIEFSISALRPGPHEAEIALLLRNVTNGNAPHSISGPGPGRAGQ